MIKKFEKIYIEVGHWPKHGEPSVEEIEFDGRLIGFESITRDGLPSDSWRVYITSDGKFILNYRRDGEREGDTSEIVKVDSLDVLYHVNHVYGKVIDKAKKFLEEN